MRFPTHIAKNSDSWLPFKPVTPTEVGLVFDCPLMPDGS